MPVSSSHHGFCLCVWWLVVFVAFVRACVFV
jgi:RasGEF domain